MPAHIKEINWVWGVGTLAAKNFSGNIVQRFPPITPGEVIITKYLVNNVITNVISGGTYNQWPVMTTFTDNQDGSWFMEEWLYSDTRQRRGIHEKVYW